LIPLNPSCDNQNERAIARHKNMKNNYLCQLNNLIIQKGVDECHQVTSLDTQLW